MLNMSGKYLRYNSDRRRALIKKRAIIMAIITSTACLMMKPKSIERRWWVRPWLENKDQASLKLVKKEFQKDKQQFKQYLRLSEDNFNLLLKLVEARIQKTDTKFRNAISAEDKLIVTLRFLATGETYRSLMYSFRISESTISLFVPIVCRAIYDVLKNTYLKTPNTSAEWLNIAKDFENNWNVPNVIGALDGKHIVFRAPRADGSTYYNYKNTHSIVLLALVDANYNFIYVDVGVNGRVSDGGVWRQSTLARAIAANSLNIPEDRNLPGREKLVPHLILADAAFPLNDQILKPYPLKNMAYEQRIFNYRLSRGRMVVENAFGILANRFRVLLTTINLKPEKVQVITLACCVLHNFIKAENPNYMNDVDRNHVIVFGLSRQSGNRSRVSSISIREEFKEYFNNEGSVPWQDDKI